MLSQVWIYLFFVSFWLSSAVMFGGNKAGNATFFVYGRLLFFVNLIFIVISVFLAEKWWYGLLALIIAQILVSIVGRIRALMMMIMPMFWSIMEIIGAPIATIITYVFFFLNLHK